MKWIILTLSVSFSVFAQEIIELPNIKNIGSIAQEKIIEAPPGSTIIFPEGTFYLTDELIVNTSHITIKGQGHDKTILNFKNQQVGAQGILATKDAFTIEDIAIEDTKGDGIKVERSNGVVFRNVRIEWTRGPHTENGAYGFYPVQTQNVLIEKCIVKGASDAGVYVGQSTNIIVRENQVEWNVAGIEIENSRYADVYDNHTINNTAGILVFDLPNLAIKGGKQTRVYNNLIEYNNTKNFAPKGNIVGGVPGGTGIMVIANDDIEIFGNTIVNNYLTGIILANYKASGNKIEDPTYDPKVERINIHDNIIQRYTDFQFFPKIFESEMHFMVYFHTTLRAPEIITDGVDDGTYHGEKFTADTQICIQDNVDTEKKPINIVNLHLDSGEWSFFGKIPGGPVDFNSKDYDCKHPELAQITLEKMPDLPKPQPKLSKEKVRSLCSINSQDKPNYEAFFADCPKLSDYNLFSDSADPSSVPNGEIKLPYKLSSKLFTDYALKDRVIFLPKGGTIDYHPIDVLRFPTGTLITKTFKYPKDFNHPDKDINVIETRILVKRDDGWHALPYVWDHVKKDAFLSRGGANIWVESTLENGKQLSFNYQVPSENKCFSCHEVAGNLAPIGPQAKLMAFDHTYPDGEKENQLMYMFKKEVLKGTREPLRNLVRIPDYDDESHSLTDRAKAYMHINCAHCHQPSGRARTSGLYLEFERDHATAQYGNCKPPVAAGRGSGENKYVIEPGAQADKSILHVRVNSSDPGVMMPEVGRTMIHTEGVKLIADWIESLPFRKCN